MGHPKSLAQLLRFYGALLRIGRNCWENRLRNRQDCALMVGRVTRSKGRQDNVKVNCMCEILYILYNTLSMCKILKLYLSSVQQNEAVIGTDKSLLKKN